MEPTFTSKVPDCFYRISAKALILDGKRRFLLLKEPGGGWELPGGGLDFGETWKTAIERELLEEAGLVATYVSDKPSYFFSFPSNEERCWKANIVYLTKVKTLDFTPSEECEDIRFFTKEEALKTDPKRHLRMFIDLYKP